MDIFVNDALTQSHFHVSSTDVLVLPEIKSGPKKPIDSVIYKPIPLSWSVSNLNDFVFYDFMKQYIPSKVKHFCFKQNHSTRHMHCRIDIDYEVLPKQVNSCGCYFY